MKVIEDNTEKWLNAFDKFGSKFLENAADALLDNALRNIEIMNAAYKWELHGSGGVSQSGDSYFVTFKAPHAPYVEYGRAPGKMPPVKLIKEWVEYKNIGDPKKTNNTAWAIAKKIKDKGIEEKPFLRNAIETLRNDVDRIIDMTKTEVGIRA